MPIHCVLLQQQLLEYEALCSRKAECAEKEKEMEEKLKEFKEQFGVSVL